MPSQIPQSADLDVVARHERGTRLQMVHQRLVAELSLEAARIADAVPRLDTDEGGLLAVRTPKGDDRRAEGERHLRLAIGPQQFGTMQLALVDLDGVVAPGVVGEFHDAVFGLNEGHLVHLMRAVAVAVEGVHRLLVVETDTAVLVLAGLHARHVEGGVAANLEVYLSLVCVVDVPDDTYCIIIKHVADAEGEVVGIDLLRVFRRFEGEGHLALILGDERKLGIAGKTVAGQMILLPVDTIGLVVDAAHDGEEDGRAARPELGIALPQIFLTIGILDALELGSFLRYDDGELFVS